MKRVDQWRTPTFKWISYQTLYKQRQVIFLLFSVSIPSLVIGSVLYFFGREQIESELMTYHDEHINNQVAYFDEQIKGLEDNLNYWSHEHLFIQDLHLINYQENFQFAQEITSSLFSKQNGHGLVERISLFIDLNRPAVFNPQYRWVDEEDQLQKYYKYLRYSSQFFWHTREAIDGVNPHMFPLVLVKNIPSYSTSGNSASIIVELNHEALLSMLDGFNFTSEGMTFLIDQKNDQIITRNESDIELIEFMNINAIDYTTSTRLTYENMDYSIRSGTITRVDTEWRYLSIVPVSSITAPITDLSKLIVAVSIFVFLVSVAMALVTYRSLYRPIARIVQLIKGQSSEQSSDMDLVESHWQRLQEEKLALEHHADQLNDRLISNLFFQLIEGYLPKENERDLRLKLKQYNIDLDEHTLTYVDIETTTKRQQHYVVQQIAQHIDYQHICIPFNDTFFGIVIIAKEQDPIGESIKQLFDQLNQDPRVDPIFMYQSQSVFKLTDLPAVVERIRQRKFKGTDSNQSMLVVMPDDIKTSKGAYIMYPFDIESNILKAIEGGKTDDIEVLLNEFVKNLKENDEAAISFGLIQLYGAIQTHVLKNDLDPLVLTKGKNILREILKSHDTTRFMIILKEALIKPYMTQLALRTESKQEYIVKEVSDYIHQNYNKDISLEECADELGLNTYTVSRFFKQGKGENFIDYLTRYRIEKSKLLLSTTSMKIQDVAEAVGYRHSYFNRIFKKHVGLTPGKYRISEQK